VVLNNDYLDVLRPIGSAYDIGAFEVLATVTAPLPAPITTPTPSPVITTTTTTKDITPPVVSIYNPSQDMVVKKGAKVLIVAYATDNVGVTSMSLYVDGGSNIRSSTYVVYLLWDSTNAKVGTHSVKVSASDARSNLGSKYITFKVVL